MHKTKLAAATRALSLRSVAAFTSGVTLGAATVVLVWAIIVARG